MLEQLLERDDVQKLIYSLCTNQKYYKKDVSDAIDHQMFVETEQVLFLFYDALFKYQLIIEDSYYFDDYIEQLDLLFKKLDRYHAIVEGIHRILGRICASKLGIKNIDSLESKERILNYIYRRYIENGYLIHGFSSCYNKEIQDLGFYPEEYRHFYDRFVQIQNILKMHGAEDLLDKDFSKKEVVFTDSFLKGCHYSAWSPGYFSNLLCGHEFIRNEKERSSYYRGDYEQCFKNIQRLCDRFNFSEQEKKFMIDAFRDEWELLEKGKGKISVMLVPRSLFSLTSSVSISEMVKKDSSLGEMIGKILTPKFNSVLWDGAIDSSSIEIITLPSYSQFVEQPSVKLVENVEENFYCDEFELSNVYGKASVFLLLGAVLVTLGVIISIILLV